MHRSQSSAPMSARPLLKMDSPTSKRGQLQPCRLSSAFCHKVTCKYNGGRAVGREIAGSIEVDSYPAIHQTCLPSECYLGSDRHPIHDYRQRLRHASHGRQQQQRLILWLVLRHIRSGFAVAILIQFSSACFLSVKFSQAPERRFPGKSEDSDRDGRFVATDALKQGAAHRCESNRRSTGTDLESKERQDIAGAVS